MFGSHADYKGGLQLHSLDPLTGKWVTTPINQSVRAGGKPFGIVGGNLGTVMAFDQTTGSIYVLVGNPPPSDDEDSVMHVAMIDVSTAVLVKYPVLGRYSSAIFGLLEQMVWA